MTSPDKSPTSTNAKASSSAMQQSTASSGGGSDMVYTSGGSPMLGSLDEQQRGLSPKVQQIAAAIYHEFELMISNFGEDSVKTLMPMVVNSLESLDLAYIEKEEATVDLEMIREDNEQLLTQYEREKAQRKQLEQKFMDIEDQLAARCREYEDKLDALASVARMADVKAKHAAEHAARMDERETEQKMEFDKLHDRYNQLLRTHIDHVERTKYLMGADKFELMQSLPVDRHQPPPPVGQGALMAASMDGQAIRGVSDIISAHMSRSTTMDVNLAYHISNQDEKDWQDEFGQSASDVEALLAASPRAPPQKDELPSESESSAQPQILPPPQQAQIQEQDQLGADLTGMGKEVENLIRENTELLETKNALNIVKNDLIAQVDELSSEQDVLREEVRSLELVRAKMSERMRELEDELKKVREQLSKKEESEEEEMPLSQRKRFTRSEMQRVLLERNTYKERLMELEESMKWTELQRQKKLAAENAAVAAAGTKKGTGIWDFFSNLFGESSSPPRRQSPNSTTSSSARRRRRESAANPSSKTGITKSLTSADLADDADIVSERRVAQRREQYKLVREHVKKDDQGRLQAYGWSIPATVDRNASASQVPVPVCCRPLIDNQPTLKVWCSTALSLHGGRTPSGVFLAADPVFCPNFSVRRRVGLAAARKLQAEVGSSDLLKQEMERAKRMAARDSELAEWTTSSVVWVASSNQGRSHVVVLDANNPNGVLDTFVACDSHLLCMQGVPGVLEGDGWMDEPSAKELLRGGGYLKEGPPELLADEASSSLGEVGWEELRTISSPEEATTVTLCSNLVNPSPTRTRDFSVSEGQQNKKPQEESHPLAPGFTRDEDEDDDEVVTARKKKSAPQASPSLASRSALPVVLQQALAKYSALDTTSTCLPTVWMGAQNGYIYVHSAVGDWRKCLVRIKMPDAILNIIYLQGRIFAALANGTIAVFHRNKQGAWSSDGYHTVRVGRATNSVRALCTVGAAGVVWAAYKNSVLVINVDTLSIEGAFAAHPRKESQVRAMQAVGVGVWLSVRFDSTLRLFHARTHQHLQDVDLEPYVTKMLGTARLDSSRLRATALLVSNRRLWIGTCSGVVISVPLGKAAGKRQAASEQPVKGVSGGPGGLVRVYVDRDGKRPSLGDGNSDDDEFVPLCELDQAQLSFHGHKDAVRFFLAVPSAERSTTTTATTSEAGELRKQMVLSGGDGYIDFRMGDEGDEQADKKTTAGAEAGGDSLTPEPSSSSTAAKTPGVVRPRDLSHIIVWEVDAELPVLSSSAVSPSESVTGAAASS